MTEIVSRETVSRSLHRRLFLQQTACGLGTVALGHLLSRDGQGAGPSPAAGDRSHPLAPRQPHFPPRARNVIFIFMAGAPSQLDLFDPKPEMRRLHGQPVPDSFLDGLEDPLIKGSAVVFASPGRSAVTGNRGPSTPTMSPISAVWPITHAWAAVSTPTWPTTTRRS